MSIIKKHFNKVIIFFLPLIFGNTVDGCEVIIERFFFKLLLINSPSFELNDFDADYRTDPFHYTTEGYYGVANNGVIYHFESLNDNNPAIYTHGNYPDFSSIVLIDSTIFSNVPKANIVVGENGIILRRSWDTFGWDSIPSPTTNNLNSIDFLWDFEFGFLVAVGDAGTVIRSTDFGLSWHILPFPNNTINLIDVEIIKCSCPPAYRKIRVTGSVYTLGETTDWGETWEFFQSFENQLSSPGPMSLNTIFSYDTNLVFVGGEFGIVLKSTNGGDDWTSMSVPGFEEINSIYFISPDSGMVAGSPGAARFTTNGGVNWFEDSSVTSFLDGRDVKRFVPFGKNYGMVLGSGGLTMFAAPDSTYLDSLGNPTSVESELQSPKDFILYQNYPNPFNPTTNFEFRIADYGMVSLKIYDMLGREITTLVNEEKSAGSYVVEFDASGLSSGIYFYQLNAGIFSMTKKFVLMK